MFSHFSIFNENTDGFKLWNKKCSDFANCNQDTEFEAEAWKPSTEKGSFARRCFAVKGTFLFYKKRKESKKASGILNLRWSTAKFNRVEDEELKEHFGYFLMLIKNSKYTRIFLKNKEEMERWRQALKEQCIMNDFEERYNLLEMIGKGAYGKVSCLFLPFYSFYLL